MTTVTLSLATEADARSRLAKAFDGQAQQDRITFFSAATLWQVLTPRRWNILAVLTGAGPLAIREVARRLGRDVKAVHCDVHALIDAGILQQGSKGVSFPYDALHVDFTLTKAA